MVDCTSLGLSAIPSGIPTGTTVLFAVLITHSRLTRPRFLRNNALVSIGSQAFNTLVNLQQLYVNCERNDSCCRFAA